VRHETYKQSAFAFKGNKATVELSIGSGSIWRKGTTHLNPSPQSSLHSSRKECSSQAAANCPQKTARGSQQPARIRSPALPSSRVSFWVHSGPCKNAWSIRVRPERSPFALRIGQNAGKIALEAEATRIKTWGCQEYRNVFLIQILERVW
jgi:hypothetical protein